MYSLTQTTVAPGLWGGYAEYMFLRPNTIVHKLPEHLTVEDAVLFNPIGAGFDWACRVLGTRVGDAVLILGPGQRGLACVIAAVEAGADTIIVTGRTRDVRKLELARHFGATHTINAELENVVQRVQEITGGSMVDGVIDVTPYATQPILDAIEAVKTGGTIVVAGVKGMREVPGFVSDKLYLKAITMRGVFSVSYWAYEQAIRLISSHKYPLERMHTHTLPIDNLDRAMRLMAGEVDGEEAIHITVVPRLPP
jgi:threonine dehydrogenase-like Zn-dependent dehydrogenase